jgi:hypothetical protein
MCKSCTVPLRHATVDKMPIKHVVKLAPSICRLLASCALLAHASKHGLLGSSTLADPLDRLDKTGSALLPRPGVLHTPRPAAPAALSAGL